VKFARASTLRAAAALLCALPFAAASAQEQVPFRAVNLSPPIAVFGLPVWEVGSAGAHVTLAAQIANDYRFSAKGRDEVILDGETWRTSVTLERGWRRGWMASVEIPYYRMTGGMLDDVIDAWHSAFNLPDGSRNERPPNRLLFALADGGGPFLVLRQRGGGLGDSAVSVGRAFGTARARTLLKGTLKLPTGDADSLTGSGSADFALSALRTRRLAGRRPAGFFWGLGVARFGDASRIRYAQRSTAYFGMLGAGIRLWRHTGLKAQVDVHSALYESPLVELGRPAAEASIGGWRELGERRWLEFAVDEDLSVGTAPDVTVHFAFRWEL
jgi:hypothetical protein